MGTQGLPAAFQGSLSHPPSDLKAPLDVPWGLLTCKPSGGTTLPALSSGCLLRLALRQLFGGYSFLPCPDLQTRYPCVFLEDSWVFQRMGTPHRDTRELPPQPPLGHRRDPVSSGGTGRCTDLRSAQLSVFSRRPSSPYANQNPVAV